MIHTKSWEWNFNTERILRFCRLPSGEGNPGRQSRPTSYSACRLPWANTENNETMSSGKAGVSTTPGPDSGARAAAATVPAAHQLAGARSLPGAKHRPSPSKAPQGDRDGVSADPRRGKALPASTGPDPPALPRPVAPSPARGEPGPGPPRSPRPHRARRTSWRGSRRRLCR